MGNEALNFGLSAYFATCQEDFSWLFHLIFTFKVAMEIAKKLDTDGDGIIDNSGFPDQTYDAWTVSGARWV